ncbi:MAG TPA: EAL domain-containing protein [Gammaproteobacteria bacterium]
MRSLYSIKYKLLLLLLLTLVLTLALVGTAINTLITTFHRQQASEVFTDSHRIINEELEARGSRLVKQARTVAQRTDLIAAVAMIRDYATPADYQPLLFDEEKRAIARELFIEARAADIGMLALYTDAGELVAFHSQEMEEHGGYLTYVRGVAQLMARQVGEEEQWHMIDDNPAMHFHPPAEEELESVIYRYHDRRFEIEVSAPLIRRYPDGSSRRIGFVVASDLISGRFLTSLETRSGVDSAIYFGDGGHIGTIATSAQQQLQSLIAAGALGIDTHQESETNEHFLSAFPVVLAGGERAYFTATIDKRSVTSAIRATQKTVFPLLLLALLIIVPLGSWAANRVISTPVQQLANAVAGLERGDFSGRVVVTGNDEIGMLARAFNDMSAAIKRREEALVASETKYRTLVDNLPQRVFYKDLNSVYISCNRRYAADLGIEPAGIVGKSDFDFYSAAAAEKFRADDQAIMASRQLAELEERYEPEGGSPAYIHTVKTPMFDEQGNCTGILGIFWDITEKKQADERLRQSATVFESTGEGVIITDPQLNIIAINKAFTEITGYTEAEMLGKKPNIRRSKYHDTAFYEKMWHAINTTGRWQGEIWNRTKQGEPKPEWMTISTVHDEQGRVSNYVAVFSDISEVKESQQRLDHLAHHDPLTNLPNRLLLTDRLEHAIARARRSGESVAVLFLDLDRFKNINDTLGHPVGDDLLMKVAERLREVLRETQHEGDTVARLGGDEFVVLLEGVDAQEEIEDVANRILDHIGTPFTVQGQELYIGASIGISLFPGDGEEVATLIRNADTAMYRAKEQGRDTFRFYTAELTSEALSRMSLEASLRYALIRNELQLHYQPQYDFTSGELVGAEALLRWHNPEHGRVSPDRFIPLAEDIGLIVPLGEWVLATACTTARQWLDQGLSLQTISVNLSGIQLQRDDIVEKVELILRATRLPPHMLELEITETVLMRQPEQAQALMDRLRALGVGLAVDDFGTGYSSLSYLKRFPITNLKIDKSFVRDIPHDANDTAITQAVIALGHSLQLKVTAEGVESEQQAQLLRTLGCDKAQGYLYGRPVPAEEFRTLASRQVNAGVA